MKLPNIKTDLEQFKLLGHEKDGSENGVPDSLSHREVLDKFQENRLGRITYLVSQNSISRFYW